MAYEALPLLLVSGPLLRCLSHLYCLYDNTFSPPSEATGDKDKCACYLHKVLRKERGRSLRFYALQSAILAVFPADI